MNEAERDESTPSPYSSVNKEVGSDRAEYIPAIQSAMLNIGTAASDCGSARDAWTDANWDDAVMWINNAISQLESARAKIEAHRANAGLLPAKCPECDGCGFTEREIGGCDMDGENDTRECVPEQCQLCGGSGVLPEHGKSNAGVSIPGDELGNAPRECSRFNQCDGCRRGLAIDALRIHREADGQAYMVCESSRY
jgi:hypothetical protein